MQASHRNLNICMSKAEYKQFIKEAEEAGQTRIGFLRHIWKQYKLDVNERKVTDELSKLIENAQACNKAMVDILSILNNTEMEVDLDD